jgi:hypothetical protein
MGLVCAALNGRGVVKHYCVNCLQLPEEPLNRWYISPNLRVILVDMTTMICYHPVIGNPFQSHILKS